jgi:hypothetical protein
MSIAIADLKLEKLIVVYPGKKSYVLAPRVAVAGMMNIESVLPGK